MNPERNLYLLGEKCNFLTLYKWAGKRNTGLGRLGVWFLNLSRWIEFITKILAQKSPRKNGPRQDCQSDFELPT